MVLWLSLLLRDGVLSSEHDNKTCSPSQCGIITNISYPFRLPHDPPHCGKRSYELASENNVSLLHLQYYYDDDGYDLKNGTYRDLGTYRVVGINYNNFTIRLVDPGIQEGNCSSLPLYSLSSSNFNSYVTSDGYNEDGNNPYSIITLKSYERILFEQVGYLKCSDAVRDEAAYVDTASCMNWESKGGGHVYAVAGELQAHQFQPQCLLKSVTLIAPEWKSMAPGGRIKSYADIHKLLSYGFELSWLPRACADRNCSNGTCCVFSPETQSQQCVPHFNTGKYLIPISIRLLDPIFFALPNAIHGTHLITSPKHRPLNNNIPTNSYPSSVGLSKGRTFSLKEAGSISDSGF